MASAGDRMLAYAGCSTPLRMFAAISGEFVLRTARPFVSKMIWALASASGTRQPKALSQCARSRSIDAVASWLIGCSGAGIGWGFSFDRTPHQDADLRRRQ